MNSNLDCSFNQKETNALAHQNLSLLPKSATKINDSSETNELSYSGGHLNCGWILERNLSL